MIIVTSRQSLLDIALQHCGAMEDAFALAVENGISLTDELANGQELQSVPVSRSEVVNYYSANSIYPASAVTAALLSGGEGIEFWAVEYDFIIS